MLTQWYRRLPSQDLQAQCMNVWQMIPVCKDRQSVTTDHGIELPLSFPLDFWEAGHREEECVHRRVGLVGVQSLVCVIVYIINGTHGIDTSCFARVSSRIRACQQATTAKTHHHREKPLRPLSTALRGSQVSLPAVST